MDLKGSKTERNLKAALAGESIARNKYTYFGEKARKEGELELAEMYERLARNESAHAKFWYTALHGAIQGNMENLRVAATGEFEEWAHMYPEFAKTAREEGFEDLAMMFERVAAIEKDHERQFMEAVLKMAKRSQEIEKELEEQIEEEEAVIQTKEGYRCVFCGATFEERPDVCPVCQAIGAFEPCTISQ